MKNFLPKSNSSSKGFTLIELMVVISIIAFLAVIGVAAYSNAQKTARDGRRKADIDAISQAMESNYSTTTGLYPTALLATMFASGVSPVDPSGGSSCLPSGTTACTYIVGYLNSNKGFSACAALEAATGNASLATGGTGGQPTYSGTNTANNYCKSSQQSQ